MSAVRSVTTSTLLALALLSPASPRVAHAQADSLAAAPADSAATSRANAALRDEEFPVTLGSFTTTLRGSRPERTANIVMAAGALDGAVVAPGEVLSFNRVVGPRTLERGYQAAPVILHETRQLQTGGGVCQVASTIFAAGLLAGLSSVERWRHSSPVDYIAPGEDATIAWGAKDLKLRNDLAQRVRLRVRVLGSTLGVLIEGEGAEPVEYDLETVLRELPADPGAEGGQPGREIELYRVRRGGRAGESRELVHRDVYPPSRGRPTP
jgi:vancomycin resistance protein YoaR